MVNRNQQVKLVVVVGVEFYPKPKSCEVVELNQRLISNSPLHCGPALTRMRAHGVPFYLVATVLAALIVALIICYVYHYWALFAVVLLLLIVLAFSLRTIWLIDIFRRRKRES
jgi:uncharacterized protein (DUF983 family)